MRAAIRAVVALLLPWLAAACAGQTNQEFDMRLREMSGSNERALLGGMGRIPDNSYQLDEDTKILQWRWDTSYITGGWAPTYQRVGWGMWMHDLPLASTNQGQRVVLGQRATQGSPDIFLGWGEAEGKHFYVRQLADMKGSASFAEGDQEGIGRFIEYCGLCGWALALAHAKSGDPAMIAGYCGNSAVLDDAITKFAQAYAKQTEQDHAALDKARRAGRITAAAGRVV